MPLGLIKTTQLVQIPVCESLVCVSHMLVCVCVQEASRNADELLQAEEKEKREAEKRRQKNKKVSRINLFVDLGVFETIAGRFCYHKLTSVLNIYWDIACIH